VPLARNTALGIALMSYDGRLCFGLLGDFDTLPDVDLVADCVEAEIEALAEAAGVARSRA
jgi:diacylglycerol O-acyltransferase / wax synthase